MAKSSIFRGMPDSYRIGEAAQLLGVRVETLRRWARDGKIRTSRTSGGQREVPAAEVARLLAERRETKSAHAHKSRRNAFPSLLSKVTNDTFSALVVFPS